jgi:hypothetical protein
MRTGQNVAVRHQECEPGAPAFNPLSEIHKRSCPFMASVDIGFPTMGRFENDRQKSGKAIEMTLGAVWVRSYACSAPVAREMYVIVNLYKVRFCSKGTGPHTVLIEAQNQAGAKSQVEARYPGAYSISMIQLPSSAKKKSE